MTEQEAKALFTSTLERLSALSCDGLVREIESTVARGRPRKAGQRNEGTLQDPMTPREALVVALHMLVAAAEPPMLVASAEKALGARVAWETDELAITRPEVPLLPRAAARPLEVLPDLSSDAVNSLRAAATALLKLVRELEAEVDADAS